ncbi:MAG: hypothetical protein QNL62_19635 [Gammaproteobacteria bacterium]|nr:hypothetical protein [Gammaproteobacteria bacterium]
MHQLIKSINSISRTESPSFKRIKAEAQKRGKFINRDVSLTAYLPELTRHLDKINQKELSAWELSEFNDLMSRFLGALLEQEMTEADIEWK